MDMPIALIALGVAIGLGALVWLVRRNDKRGGRSMRRNTTIIK